MSNHSDLKQKLVSQINRIQQDLSLLDLIPEGVAISNANYRIQAIENQQGFHFISVSGPIENAIEMLPPLSIKVVGGQILPNEKIAIERSPYSPIVKGSSSVLGSLWYFTKLADGSICRVHFKDVEEMPLQFQEGKNPFTVHTCLVYKAPVIGSIQFNSGSEDNTSAEEASSAFEDAKVVLKYLEATFGNFPIKESISNSGIKKWISEWLTGVVSQKIGRSVSILVDSNLYYVGVRSVPKDKIVLDIKLSFGKFRAESAILVNNAIDPKQGFDWRSPYFVEANHAI